MRVAESGSAQSTFVATLVDEWVRCGITDAVVCPGSRSTPLVLALLARGEIRLHVRLDERGAGFYAIGLALGSNRVPIVCTTSGTAAAELHPSVVEAHLGRIAIILCTADRPFELHHVGAPQSIDQTNLYSNAVRWFAEPGLQDGSEASRRSWRSLADRAFYEATSGPVGPGPVHLNLAFKEPLNFEPGPLPNTANSLDEPKISLHSPAPALSHSALASSRTWLGRRGVIIAGAGCGPIGDVIELSVLLSWPVLADPRSRCRVRHPNVIASTDSIFRSNDALDALEPQVVLSLGSPWASRSIADYTRRAGSAGAQIVAVDPWWRWVDPDRIVTDVHRCDPSAWLSATRALLAGGDSDRITQDCGLAGEWLGRWKRVDLVAQEALDTVLAQDCADRDGALSEPTLARHLLTLVPDDTKVVVSSSMPIRDLECYTPALHSPPEVLSNRGANGIDGVCSTAIGVAASNASVVALLGDLAFLHDVSALVTAATHPVSTRCVIVVIDNHGGAIFSFLPQVNDLDKASFERLFTTPQAPSVTAVASGFGLRALDVHTLGGLDSELNAALNQEGISVIRAIVPGVEENASLHQRINDFVTNAIESAL